MAGNDLGSLLGGLLGGASKGSGSGAGNILGALLSALGGARGSGGGASLGGLLDLLAKSGLAAQKDSWVGTGANQPVTGAQIQQALPDETLRQVARETGVPPGEVAGEIAQVLPSAVDRLTPNGEVPASLEELARQQSL